MHVVYPGRDRDIAYTPAAYSVLVMVSPCRGYVRELAVASALAMEGGILKLAIATEQYHSFFGSQGLKNRGLDCHRPL